MATRSGGPAAPSTLEPRLGVLVLSGTLSQLLGCTGFAVVLFSGVAVAGLFVLRRRDGASERSYSTWGYPVAPAIFVLASAVLVLNEIASRPGPALAGLGVMAAGVPVFWWMRANGARFRAEDQAAWPGTRGGVPEGLGVPAPRRL